MKIIRSIVGIVVGLIVMVIVIMVAETIGGIVYQPADTGPFLEWSQKIQEDKAAMKAYVESVPPSAQVLLLVGWNFGGYLGAGLAALIAARLVHAGIIGVILVANIIANFYIMKVECDISHPDWLIVVALVLPIPISLLAGKLVAVYFPARAIPAPGENGTMPPRQDGTFKEGEPPLRPR